MKDKFIYIAKPNILSSQRSTFNLKPFDNAIPHKFISCSFQCLGQGTLPQLFVQKLKLLDFVIIKTRYKTIVLWNFKRILFTSESYLAFFGVNRVVINAIVDRYGSEGCDILLETSVADQDPLHLAGSGSTSISFPGST